MNKIEARALDAVRSAGKEGCKLCHFEPHEGTGPCDDCLAAVIVEVAQEFAREALEHGMPEVFHTVSFGDHERRKKAIDEAISAAARGHPLEWWCNECGAHNVGYAASKRYCLRCHPPEK